MKNLIGFASFFIFASGCASTAIVKIPTENPFFIDNFYPRDVLRVQWTNLAPEGSSRTKLVGGNVELSWVPFDFYQNGFRNEIVQNPLGLWDVRGSSGADAYQSQVTGEPIPYGVPCEGVVAGDGVQCDGHADKRWGSESIEQLGGEVWYRFSVNIDPTTNVLDYPTRKSLGRIASHVFLAQWHTIGEPEKASPIIGLLYGKRDYPAFDGDGKMFNRHCQQGEYLQLTMKIPNSMKFCNGLSWDSTCQKVLWEMPITKGETYDIAFHVNWGSEVYVPNPVDPDSTRINNQSTDQYLELYVNGTRQRSNIRDCASKDRCVGSRRFYFPNRQNDVRNQLRLGAYLGTPGVGTDVSAEAAIANSINEVKLCVNQLGAAIDPCSNTTLMTLARNAVTQINNYYASNPSTSPKDNLSRIFLPALVNISNGNGDPVAILEDAFLSSSLTVRTLESFHIVFLAQRIQSLLSAVTASGFPYLNSRFFRVRFDNFRVGPTGDSVGIPSGVSAPQAACKPWEGWQNAAEDTAPACAASTGNIAIPSAAGLCDCNATKVPNPVTGLCP